MCFSHIGKLLYACHCDEILIKSKIQAQNQILF